MTNVKKEKNRLHPLRATRRFFIRITAPFARLSVRWRVFLYFLVFTAALLTLLWFFQIALLSDFYQWQKTSVLNSAVDSLTSNIDNTDLQRLSDRISKANDVCVLIVNDQGEKLVSSEANGDCVIHRMSGYDLQRYTQLAQKSDGILYRILELGSPAREPNDDGHFNGHVPPAAHGKSKSMVAISAVQTASGETLYVLVNAIITPVDATVNTLRSQYLFIALLMVLLSFGLSLILSRHIAQPIISTTRAAKGLSDGRFEPGTARAGYREILQLNATLAQAACDLQRVERMQRELIANISHDLRTPLTLIEGYAEAMRDLPGENTPENMQVIIEETRRLTSLVNAVLHYSTIQNGLNPVQPLPYSLTDSIRDILNRYGKLTGLDGYTIRFEQTEQVTVNADEMKIGQVVYNLVNNALTYTGADKTVTVTQRVTGNTVRVEVHDSGEGISKEELPHIWSRYYRGQNPHKRATVGTGLGLSIVKGVLDSHGVCYGVESEAGCGTTFWFELPVVQADPLPKPDSTPVA